VEREIERQARRWQLGARIGAGLDPELFMLGVHAGIGPIFSRDFSFRPNAEFVFGELTDMVALNLEGAYRLPISFRHGRWSAYVGAGPGLNLIHQGIGRRDIDFGNFDYDTSLTVFSGANDFLRQVDLLGKKLGSILFQLPPSLEFNAGRTTAFLTLFREMHNEDIAFETTARKLVPTWCWRFVYRVSCGSRCRPSRRDCRCQRPRWVEWRCLLPFARLPSEVLLSLRF